MRIQQQATQKIMNLTKNNNRTAELIMYGDIGDSFFDDIEASSIVKQLSELDVDEINVKLSSNGGGTTAAISIANALKRHKAKVIVDIDGIAASAATVITSAADVVNMPKNALFMVHNPWTVAAGEQKDFEKMATVLSKVKDSIVATYISKTGQTKEHLSELMDAETWLNAEEAKALNFVDNVIGDIELERVGNRLITKNQIFNMANFKNYKEEKERKMTKEEIKNQFPEIYKEIVDEAKLEERNRIKELKEIGEDSEIVNKAMFEEPRNASEVALDVIKEMKNKATAATAATTVETTTVVNTNDYRMENKPISVNTAINNTNNKATFMDVDLDLIIANMNKEVK